MNVKLHYVESGPKDKPVVLLLHGFPDCWISWRHQVAALSNYFRVISLDLKGFGDSDKPSSRRSYKVDVVLSELRDLIHSLGVTSCTVVGHDLGALIGWYLVHLCPQYVSKFVSISCPHPNFYWAHLPDANFFNTNWVHYSQLPHLPEKDALKNDLNIINQCYQHLTVKNLKEVAFLDAYKYYFSRKEDWTGAINYYRNLPFCRVRASESCPVEVPCLLILGNQDFSVQLESVVRSTEYLSKYQLKIIDSAGHFPHQERPEEVNVMLLNFLIFSLAGGYASKMSKQILSPVPSTLSGFAGFARHCISQSPEQAVRIFGGISIYFDLKRSISCNHRTWGLYPVISRFSKTAVIRIMYHDKRNHIAGCSEARQEGKKEDMVVVGLEKETSSSGLLNLMYGAVTSTVKFGNNVLRKSPVKVLT
ncbi:hypothetical protein J6590_041420 [Homalodisca vitripennis]|nr:hypothetical protein J6590_041420 [Homalodisca vitripennis]